MQLLSTTMALAIPLLFHQMQTTTATVDMTIDKIASDVLSRALERIPEGAAVTTVVAENSIDKYVDISALPILQDVDLNDNHLSGILAFNASNFESVDGNLRTKVSWTVSSCICVDENCDNTASIDIRGGRNIDAASENSTRGQSPIVLHDILSDGTHNKLPCLAVYQSPSINKDEVVFKNCTFVDQLLPSNDSLKDPRFLVENCLDGRVDNLRLYEKSQIDGENYGMTVDKYFGRPLTGMEVTPSNIITDPYHSFGDILDNNLFFPPIVIPLINVDIGNDLKNAAISIVTTQLDIVGNFVLQREFPLGKEFTNASLEEIIRIFDDYSNDRLLSSTIKITPKDENDIRDIVGGSSLYRDLIGSVPETSPIQEILSGIVLLNLTAAVLGRTIGLLIAKMNDNKNDDDCGIKLTLCLGIFGSFAAVIAEACAYYIRFCAEIEQSEFKESMVMSTVIGGGRFGGLSSFRLGRDSDPFLVTTYVIEVADNSSDYIPLFSLGVFAAVVSFVLSLAVSCSVANSSFSGDKQQVTVV